LQRRDVVIVPGFAAVGPSGDIVLLGRGGSDLTAAFLAGALGLGEATLLKDVDGVYDRDPALFGASALRFARIGWNKAAGVAGRLVQPKAIAFAAAHSTAIRIRRTGDARATVIGAADDAPTPAKAARRIRVAVAGLGVVGGGAALRLAGSRDFELVGALVRDRSRLRGGALEAVPKVASAEALFALAPDIIIDALSDGATGRVLTEAAIARGTGVVSANKQAIAGRIHTLRALAEAARAPFHYSAAVGGGTPVIETARRARLAGDIDRIEATLNGTVNFILSGLQRGDEFSSVVAAARAAGLAEEDPSNDLNGADAAAKAAILIEEAFGVDFDPARVSRETLDEEAYCWMRREGGVWRQVTTISRDGAEISASIALVEVAPESAFARSSAEGNAVRVETASGAFEAKGRGAGRAPTVESVLADLGDARRALLGDA
jgi:homoserine dehydrogenase